MKIIILKRDKLGDLLLTTPMLQVLKKYSPSSIIKVIAPESSAWILKDPSNAILIPSKMVKPEQYTQHQWNTFNIDKKIDINQSYFEHKLKTETKQLYKIYSK